MYRNAEGQPTIEEMLEAEALAQANPMPKHLEALAQLRKDRTTYWGKDYLIGSRIDDFLRSHKASPFWN